MAGDPERSDGEYPLIPRAYITDWRKEAPWQSDAQVEQDLVICRAIVEIFSNEFLREHLAIRGGTALHKLYLHPAVRYSEDIDLIQIKSGPIGPQFDHLKNCLAFLGEPIRKQKHRNNVLLFRFESTIEPVIQLRLKVEINCREHFTLHGVQMHRYIMDSPWFHGETEISTFTLEELLGSKMRALYQRRQGRDLFDLWYALSEKNIDSNQIITCFQRFLTASKVTISRKEFQENLEKKMQDRALSLIHI